MTPELQNVLTWLAQRVADISFHQPNPVRAAEELTKVFNKALKHITEKKLIDWENLTVEIAKELRFARWEEESDLWLIPLWLYKAIPKDFPLISIGNEDLVNPTDTETRYGSLAYGVLIGGDRRPVVWTNNAYPVEEQLNDDCT